MFRVTAAPASQWHTVGSTTLDEGSARRRELQLITHNTHNRKTSMAPAGLEPTIPASLRPRGQWDRLHVLFIYIFSLKRNIFKRENSHPLYFTVIPTGKLVLNYARSSGRYPSHKMRQQCTGNHASAALPPTKHKKCTTSLSVNFKRNRWQRTVKVKLSLEQAAKAQRRSRCKALLFLQLRR